MWQGRWQHGWNQWACPDGLPRTWLRPEGLQVSRPAGTSRGAVFTPPGNFLHRSLDLAPLAPRANPRRSALLSQSVPPCPSVSWPSSRLLFHCTFRFSSEAFLMHVPTKALRGRALPGPRFPHSHEVGRTHVPEASLPERLLALRTICAPREHPGAHSPCVCRCRRLPGAAGWAGR